VTRFSEPTITEALLAGAGAVAVVGLAMYLLDQAPSAALGAVSLDAWEKRALRALADPNFAYNDFDADALQWDAAFENLRLKGLLYRKPSYKKLSDWEQRALRTLRDPNFVYSDKDPNAPFWDAGFKGLLDRGLMRVITKENNDLEFELTPEGEEIGTLQFAPTARAKRLIANIDEDAPIPSTERTPASELPPTPPKYSLSWKK